MRVFIVSIALSLTPIVVADDPVYRNPRSAIEAYLTAALAGKVDDATAIARANTQASDKDTLHELDALIDAPTLKVPTVLVGQLNGRAIAVSEQVKLTEPDHGRDTGYLVFQIILEQSTNKWLVIDIDFDTEQRKKEQVEAFKKDHSDAKSVPVTPKPNPPQPDNGG